MDLSYIALTSHAKGSKHNLKLKFQKKSLKIELLFIKNWTTETTAAVSASTKKKPCKDKPIFNFLDRIKTMDEVNDNRFSYLISTDCWFLGLNKASNDSGGLGSTIQNKTLENMLTNFLATDKVTRAEIL